MLFPWYIKYPNQNDEILNLDWILSTIDNLVNEVANFVSLNTIKYADPIQWNITTQYEKNTVVIDPITGSAYISTKPVPSGVGLNNTDYWNVIFTLDVISANKNITLRDDANNILATFESEVDDWLLWQGTLYIVTRAIEIGQSYVVGYNIDRYTVERFLKEYISNLKTYVDTTIGDLDDLETSVKTDAVAAINSLLTDVSTLIGDLSDLTTTDKDSVVDAINEIVSVISQVINIIGSLENLTTSDKDSIVDAINEVVSYCGDLTDLDTTDKTNLVAAINEAISTASDNLSTTVGDLSDLDTTDKSDVVSAINEIVGKIANKPVINIADYGAKGDNSTDNYSIIQGILNNLIGGEIIIIPAGKFVVKGTLEVKKPCTILGGGCYFKSPWSGENEGAILNFDTGGGIRLRSTGCTVEGIGISGNNNNIAIDLYDEMEVNIGAHCTNLKNIRMLNVSKGVKAVGAFKTLMEDVYVYRATVGFDLGEDPTGFTSYTLINCWASMCDHGYRLYSGSYSSLINCAADNCQQGYEVYNCHTTSFINCGVEGSPVNPFLIESSSEIIVQGLASVASGGSTYASGLIRIGNSCNNIQITGCKEIRPNAGTTGAVCMSAAAGIFFYNNDMRQIYYTLTGISANDNVLTLTPRT